MCQGDEKVRKLLAVLVVCVMFSFSACNKVDAPVVPTAMPTVTAIPTLIPTPEVVVSVGVNGKLTLLQSEINVVDSDDEVVIENVVQLEALVENMKYNFLPLCSDSPFHELSIYKDGLLYGAGDGSGVFAARISPDVNPGTYTCSIRVMVWIDHHPHEILEVPITIIVK